MSLIPRRRRAAREFPLSNWMETFLPASFEHLPELFQAKSFPPINLAEDENKITVTAELPGLDEKEIDIQVRGHQLVISGERKWEKEADTDKEFHRVESQYGSFSRTITLPAGLRTDSADAVYDKGILTIEFAKVVPTPAAKIPIKKG